MSLKGPILYQAGRKTLLSSILCNQPSRKLASYTHRGGQQYWPKCDDAVRLESRGRPVRVCLILLVDKKCRWQVQLGAVMKRKVLTTTRRKQSPTHALSTDNRLNCVRLAPAITHIADLSLVHCRFPLTFYVMSLLLTLRASSTERLCSGILCSPVRHSRRSISASSARVQQRAGSVICFDPRYKDQHRHVCCVFG